MTQELKQALEAIMQPDFGTTSTEANRDGHQYETPSQVTHTPTPWRIDRKAATRVFAGDDDTVAATACQSNLQPQWEANAAFIVRACNAHDDLVAALHRAHRDILHLVNMDRTDFRNDDPTLEIIRAALVNAEGR